MWTICRIYIGLRNSMRTLQEVGLFVEFLNLLSLQSKRKKYQKTQCKLFCLKGAHIYEQHNISFYFFKQEGPNCDEITSRKEKVFLEVITNSKHLKDRRPQTFDFNTMYTNLQHEHLIRNVKKTITEAFEYIDTFSFIEKGKDNTTT